MNFIAKFDDAVIDLFTDGYLWLWDRTGVYLAYPLGLAVLGFVSMDLLTPNALTRWLGVFLGVVWFPLVLMNFRLQRSEQFERFNDWARLVRQTPSRIYVACFFVTVGVGSGIRVASGYREAALNMWFAIFFIAAQYLQCVQIRKRDPKSFFEFAKAQEQGV